MVALLLSQIYARAERLRVQSAPRDVSPITLIELIEASYAVFERYGVGPPEDAEYHRYLLSLSIDPERDWQKKIQRFTLLDQPRIKRLCHFGNDTAAAVGIGTTVAPVTAARIDGSSRQGTRNMSNFYQHQSQQSVAASPRRRRQQPRPLNRDSDGAGAGFHGPSAAVVKSLAMPTAASRAATRLSSYKAEPRLLNSPLSPSSPQNHWQPRRDQFSDMLALSPSEGRRRHNSSNATRQQPLKENVTRNAERAFPLSPSPSSLSAKNELVGKSRFDSTPPSFKHASSLSLRERRGARSYNETTEELTLPEQYSREQDDDSVEKMMTKSFSNREMQFTNTSRQSQPLLTRSSGAKFKTLATTFENWKVIHTMRQITRQKKEHEVRMRQAAMPPICTHALFRWVVLTLPEIHAFETECQALPITMVRRISTVSNSEKLATMRFFTQRLANWTLKRIFEQWFADVSKKKLFAVRVKLRRRAQVLDTAFTCLQQWILYKEMRQCVQEKSAWIAQRHDRGFMRACLGHWRKCLYLAQSLSGAMRHHDRRLLRSTFVNWRQSMEINQRVLQLYITAVTRRVFAQWKQHSVRQRERHRQALNVESHFQRHLLVNCWRQWRNHAQRMHKLRLKLAFYHHKGCKRAKRRAFEGWTSVLSANLALRHLQNQFRLRNERRTLAKVFGEWSVWCERKRVNRLAVIDAVERLQRKHVATVFVHWKLHFTESQNQDSGIVTQVQRIEKRNLWSAWRRATRIRRVTYLLQSSYNEHLLSLFLSLWKGLTHKKLQQVEVVAGLHHKRAQRTLKVCWRAFQSNLQAKRTLRSSAAKLISLKAMTKASDHFQRWREFVEVRVEYSRKSVEVTHGLLRRGLLNRTWMTWRSQFQERNKAQLADSLVQSLYRRRLFHSWQRFWRHKQQKRAKFARIVKKLALRRLARAITRWKAVLRAKKTLLYRQQRCEKAQTIACLDKCWSTWRHAFLNRCRQQSQVIAVISRWQNQRVQNFFLKWKTRWRLRRDHRRLVAKMLVASKEKSCELYFQAWKQLCVVKIKQRAANQDATDKLSYKKLHRALLHWHQRSHSSKKRAQLLQKCLGLWRQAHLEAHFRQWQAFRRVTKRLATLSKTARAHHQRHLQATLLTKWRQWNAMRASERTKCQQRCLQIQRARLSHSVTKLRARALKAKQLKKIQSTVALLSQQGALNTSFALWKRHLTTQQRRRAKHRANLNKLKTFQLQRAIKTWEQRLRLRKRFQGYFRKAVTFSASVLVQQTLAAWRSFIEKRRFYQQLVQKALVFQVFSVLPRHFQHWQRVTNSKKRKRTLLMRASGMLCHQRESRAFVAWRCFAKDAKHTRIALAKWKNHMLSHCFTRMRRFRAIRKTEGRNFDRASTFQGRRASAKALRAWRKAARCSKLLRRFSELWKAHHSRQSFEVWTRFVRVKQSARQLLSQIRNALMLRVFNSWKARIKHETQQIQRIRLRFVLLWETDLVVKAWTSWTAFTRQSLDLKAKQRQHTRKSTRSAFQTWRRFAVDRRVLKQRARQLVGYSSTRIVRSFWAHWRWRQQLWHCVERLGRAALFKRQSSNLKEIVQCWKAFVECSIEIRNRVVSKQRRLMVTVFNCGWRQFVAIKRDEKRQKHQLEQLHTAFLTEWLAQEVGSRIMKIVICEDVKRASCLKKLIAQTWQAWLGFHERKRQQRVEVHRLQRLMVVAQASSSGLHDEQAYRNNSLKHMIVRWTRLPLAQTFETWASMAYNQRRERDQTLLALEKWQFTRTSACFTLWRTAAQHNKMENLVMKLYKAQKTRRCWRNWRVFMKTALQSKVSRLKASNWATQRISRLYFHTWSHLTTQTKLQRGLVLQLYTLSCVKLVRALFGVWKRFAVAKRTKRLQTTVAQAAYESRLTQSSWQTWRSFTHLMQFHRKQLQANTERLQVLLLCSSFRGWQVWTKQRHRMTAIARILSSKCETKTAALVLRAWHAHTVKKLTLQHTATHFSTFRALQRGVRRLRAFVTSKKRKSSAIHKAKLFLDMMRDQQLASIFVLWQQYTAKSRKKWLAMHHFEQRKLLPKLWNAWKHAVQDRKSTADRLAKAACAWKNAFRRKAWNALLLHHRLSLRARESLIQAEVHRTTRSLYSAIRDWRTMTSRSKHTQGVGRQLLVRWRLRTVYRCFMSWQSETRYGKELRRCQLVAMETSKALLRLQTWSCWRKLFVIQRTNKRKCLQRCWTQWRGFCSEKRMVVKFQQAIEVTYLQSTQRKILKQWTRFIVENKIRKAMTLLSIRFASTQVVKRTFEHWRKAVAKNRLNKHKISAVLLRMRFHSQFTVLRRLREFAGAQKRKRKLFGRASGFHNSKLQLACLCAWKKRVETTKSHREKLGRYVNLLQHSVQRKTFFAWLEFTANRQQLKLKTFQAVALRTQLSSRLVWNALVWHTRKSKQAKAATRFRDVHIAKRSLSQWRKFVVLYKIESMLGASNRRQTESCFVAWRKHVALSCNVRLFQHKVQVKQHIDQVRTCFSAWRRWSIIQRRFRQILCSAANGNHLRFRFLLWKQFASHHRRLKRMFIVPLAQAQVVQVTGDASQLPSTTLLENGGIGSLVDDSLNEDGTPGSANLHAEEDEVLGSIAIALARKARFFQRFELEWNLETTWQRWRHIFHAHLFYRMRKLHAYFVTWQSWSERRKRVRWIVQRFADRRTAFSTCSMFRGWKSAVQCVKKLQQQRIRDRELWTIVNTEMVRKERKCLKSHWKAWRFYVDEKRHLQTSVEMYHRARLVTKYWLVWIHDFMRVVREERQRVQAQQLHMTRFYKRRALQSLQSHQQWSKRARLVLEYFQNRTYDTTLSQILSHWRALVRKAKRVKRLCASMRWRWLMRAFRTWSDWQCAQRQLETQVLALMSRSKQAKVDSVWLRWRQFVSMRLATVDTQTKCTKHYLTSRLRKRWHQRIQDQRTLRSRTMQASEALVGLKLRQSVHRWRHFSSHVRLRRLYRRFCLQKHLAIWRWHAKCAIASRFEHFLLRARVKKMLVSWRQVTTKFQYWRQLCADMTKELNARRIRVVWTSWLRLVESKRRNLEAKQRFELRLRLKALNAWYQLTQCAKSNRDEQLEAAELHFDAALRRKAWNWWRTVLQQQEKKRFSLLACMVKLTSLSHRRMVEVTWKLWRQWAERERKTRALQCDFERSLQKRALTGWRQWVVDKQQSRQRRAQAESYHANRLVSVAFFYWQNYALAWKDVADANRQQSQPRDAPARCVGASAVALAVEVRVSAASEEDDQKDGDVRRSRPLSPVMKRMRQRNVSLEHESFTVSSVHT